MKNKILSFQELLKKYNVRCIFSSIDSDIVYPFDDKLGFTRVGEVSKEFVEMWVQQMKPFLGKPIAEKPRVGNKYALPIFQTETLRDIITWFIYQHDDQAYLISK